MKVIHIAARSALLASVGFAVMASPALAQSATADEGIGEIVVTANKREENLQQVPLSISAISSEQLELRGLSEVKDLSTIAPNVTIQGGVNNATAAVVSMRGIPSAADETQGFDSPIGLYLDGVFLARSSAASFEVADIQRVEVLRGPQGTLFGRNTTGGAINFITKKPSDDASLKVTAGFGSYGLLSSKAILNTGDVGGARFSLGVLHRRRNGVVDNLLELDKGSDPGSFRTTGLRFAAEIDVSDRVSIYNVFDFTRTKGVPHAMQLAEVGNGVVRPDVVYNGATFRPVQPANVGAYLAASTILEPGCGKTASRARQDSFCSETDAPSTDKVWGNMFRIEADLDGVTVRSTTAYRKWWNRVEGGDIDGLGSINGPVMAIGGPNPLAIFTGFPTSVLTNLGIPLANASFMTAGTVPTVTQSLFTSTNLRTQKQFSQELELVSSGDGPFQWVLGAIYFKESGTEYNVQRFGFVLDTNAAVYQPGSFYNPLTGGGMLISFGYPVSVAQALAGPTALAFQNANPQRYRIVPQASTFAYNSSGKSIAVYGQASYRPGGEDGAFGATLGMRYTWDEKDVLRTQNGAVPYTSAADIAYNTGAAKFSAPTGHLTFDYRASDNVNLYARAARGYRSGGFNLRQSTHDGAATVPPFGNRTLALTPFNPEKIWSYEIGAKTEIANTVRLNVAVFHNVFTDQLSTIPVPIVGSGSFGTITVNAGKTTYSGIELEGQIRLSDVLSIDGNFGYLDVNLKEFPGADITSTPRNIAGLVKGAGFASKYTASVALNATVPLSSGARLTGRLGYNYASSFEMFPNSLTAPFSVNTRGDARGLVDAQLRIDGIKMGGTNVGLTLWGKNITNKAYVTRAVDFGALGFAGIIYGDPATFGASIEFEF